MTNSNIKEIGKWVLIVAGVYVAFIAITALSATSNLNSQNNGPGY
jgi:hypothetical protein